MLVEVQPVEFIPPRNVALRQDSLNRHNSSLLPMIAQARVACDPRKLD